MTNMSVVQTPAAASPARPYSPSVLDRFTDWVDRLSIPASLFYVGLGICLVCVQLLIQWNGTPGPLYPFPYIFIVTFAYDLALMHYLDKIAAQALARFRPAVSISDSEYDDLLYRLTTLPNRPTLLACFIGLLYGLGAIEWIPFPMQIQVLHFADTPLSVNFNHALALFNWGVIGVLIYHTLHQLRVVQQIYNRCTAIDLYALRPLYAFSRLSAQTAVGIALIIYLWYVFGTAIFSIFNGFVSLAIFMIIVLLTFVLPLRGAHRLLVEEKERLLNANGERLREAVVELHKRVDAREIVDMDNLNKALASLELEHTTLERISTWPWKPETAQAVIAALLFPVVVWLIQWLLQRMLGG